MSKVFLNQHYLNYMEETPLILLRYDILSDKNGRRRQGTAHYSLTEQNINISQDIILNIKCQNQVGFEFSFPDLSDAGMGRQQPGDKTGQSDIGGIKVSGAKVLCLR